MSPATCSSSISAFLATQGPMNTQRTSGPYRCFTARAVATMGETMGMMRSVSSGWYLRTYSTTAGQALAMWIPSGCSRRKSWQAWLTRSAP